MSWDDQESEDIPQPVEAAEELNATPQEVKDIAQELMRYGYIESSVKRNVFASIMRLHKELNQIFEPFEFILKFDEYRGLAYLCLPERLEENEREERTHPLVRKQRLTLEQSLLVAILRQFYLLQEQESGIGTGTIKVPAEDILAQLTVYLGDSGSDQTNRKRLDTLLDKLKEQGIVYDADKNDDVVIRPLIVHMASPQSLTALLDQFRRLVADRESVS